MLIPVADHHAKVSPPISLARTGKLRDDVQRVTNEMTRHLERLIRIAPEQWHMLQPNWPSDPGWPHGPVPGSAATALAPRAPVPGLPRGGQ
jgi:KDO2-lipid IV(A) lauroyltransferase